MARGPRRRLPGGTLPPAVRGAGGRRAPRPRGGEGDPFDPHARPLGMLPGTWEPSISWLFVAVLALAGLAAGIAILLHG